MVTGGWVDNFMGTSTIPIHDHQVNLRETRCMIRTWLPKIKRHDVATIRQFRLKGQLEFRASGRFATLMHGDLEIGLKRLLRSEYRILWRHVKHHP